MKTTSLEDCHQTKTVELQDGVTISCSNQKQVANSSDLASHVSNNQQRSENSFWDLKVTY